MSRLNIELVSDEEGTHCELCENVLTPTTPFLFVSPANDPDEDPAGATVCLGCAREMWEFARKQAAG